MDEKQQNQLSSLINRIKLSDKIVKEAESMRFDILANVHQRMDKEVHKIPPFKIAAIAAAIAVFTVITGLFCYHIGLDEINGQLVKMSCPSGAKSTLTLPDGSIVILNGGSTLSYPSRFASNKREIQLEGEAFFDVKKDSDAPFIVQSGKINVKVLGTSFNIEAYQDDETIKVTLERGKVCIETPDPDKSLTLTPNQQAVYNKNTSQLTKTDVNVKETIAWKSNILYFNGIPLKQIARKLERQFNTHITIESEELKNTLFTGEFTEDETIDDILTVWTLDNRVKYRRNGKNIVIYE